MRGLADTCYRNRRLVVIAWLALLATAIGACAALSGEYRTVFELPDSESARALDLMEERGLAQRSGFSGQIVFAAEQGVNDPAVRRAMEDLFARVREALDEEELISPYEPQNAYQISADGRIAYAELNLSMREREAFQADAETVEALARDVDVPGLRIELGGDIFADRPEFASEVVGIVAAMIILLVAFGSVLAMGLPIVTALCGIGSGAALIGLLTRVLAVPDFTTQVAAMIGIGVGIDYALLIVTRYRHGLRDGLEPRQAIALALDTSGRAVVFAGMTVVISLLGIFMMNMDFMRSLSVSAVLAVLMTMLAAVTLLPALLGFVGRGIDRLGLPHRSAEREASEHFWYRWSRVVQAHPWPALLLSTALLVALASPVFALRLGFGDAGNRQEKDTTRRAYDLLSEGFGPGFNSPFLIIADLPEGAADAPKVQELTRALRATEGVASVAEPLILPDARLAIINLFAASAPQDKETSELVHRLREETLPPVATSTGLQIYTSGGPPIVVDFADYIASRLPLFFGAVLLLSFLLLMMVFHSVVVPVKAVVMNLLSIGAAFGAMVAIFQWGFLGSLFGLGKSGPIEAWAPMMLFAIVFGLSMDYEVFLLSRVREEYDRCGDNRQAVADGLAATGRVISAAALIMVCVFAAFILGGERVMKLMGFGLSFAIFIDATVVRLVLVPAAMELLGDLNWWMPGWLARRLPKLNVDGAAVAPEGAVAEAAS
ncbi:MAG TPA: MMPL family transporter [Dehalococcoidia bacterium]|nr:MMPL family transporter [Dehalococcoidia bacterium]